MGESGKLPQLAGHQSLYKENNESEEHLRESEVERRHITEEGLETGPGDKSSPLAQ